MNLWGKKSFVRSFSLQTWFQSTFINIFIYFGKLTRDSLFSFGELLSMMSLAFINSIYLTKAGSENHILSALLYHIRKKNSLRIDLILVSLKKYLNWHTFMVSTWASSDCEGVAITAFKNWTENWCSIVSSWPSVWKRSSAKIFYCKKNHK